MSVEDLPLVSLSSVVQRYFSLRSYPRCAIYGTSGSGKSYLADRILNQIKGLRLILDPDPTESRGTVVTSPQHFWEAAPVIGSPLVFHELGLFLRCIRHVWDQWEGDVTIMIDEADLIVPSSQPNDEVKDIIKRGRRHRIRCILATQYPTELHKIARNILDIHMLGFLRGKAGRRWGLDQLGVDPINLTDHRFVLSGNDLYTAIIRA